MAVVARIAQVKSNLATTHQVTPELEVFQHVNTVVLLAPIVERLENLALNLALNHKSLLIPDNFQCNAFPLL